MQPERDAEAEAGQRETARRLLVTRHAAVAHRVDQPVGTRRQQGHHPARQRLLLEQLEIELLFLRGQGEQPDGQPFAELERQLCRRILDLGLSRGHRVDVEPAAALVVGAHDLVELARDIDPRQRQDAIAQRELDSGELVELQQAHEQAEGRGIHEQREHHEQCGDDRREPANVLRHAVVAEHHHGQHDGDGAAQAAPDQDRLVARIDRLDEARRLQHRQHAEHHQQPGHERAARDGGEAPDIEPRDLRQHAGRQHRGQDEDQAVAPELELRPNLAQRRPLPGMQMRGPVGGDREGGHNHRHDTRDSEIAVGHDVAQIGEAHGHRGDRLLGIVEPRQEQHRRPREDEAEQDAEYEFAQEMRDGLHQTRVDLAFGTRRCPRHQDLHDQREGRDRDGIVEQRLALGEDRQALGRADVAEDADHGGRIGGRHDGAQQQADHDVAAGRLVHHERHDADADQHRDDGQEQDGEDLVEQPAHVDREAGVEQQRRQEHRQEELRLLLEPDQPLEDIVGHAARVRHRPDAEEAQTQACDREQHRVRQPQALGERHQQADQGQDHGNR